MRRSKKPARPFLRAIDEAKSAGIDENNTFRRFFKLAKGGIGCGFPGKLRGLEPAMNLQGFLCESLEKKPGDRIACSHCFIRSKSLLLAIQEKRRATLLCKKNNTPESSGLAGVHKAPGIRFLYSPRVSLVLFR